MTIEERETKLRVGIPPRTTMGEPVLIRLIRTNGGSVANGSEDNLS